MKHVALRLSTMRHSLPDAICPEHSPTDGDARIYWIAAGFVEEFSPSFP
jgi:hypothetical protein